METLRLRKTVWRCRGLLGYVVAEKRCAHDYLNPDLHSKLYSNREQLKVTFQGLWSGEMISPWWQVSVGKKKQTFICLHVWFITTMQSDAQIPDSRVAVWSPEATLRTSESFRFNQPSGTWGSCCWRGLVALRLGFNPTMHILHNQPSQAFHIHLMQLRSNNIRQVSAWNAGTHSM